MFKFCVKQGVFLKMTKYLGRRALYNFLIEKGYKPPKLKDMEYGFYYGEEWLNCNEITVHCVYGKRVYISEFKYDEKRKKFREINHSSYFLKQGKFELSYRRVYKKKVVYG